MSTATSAASLPDPIAAWPLSASPPPTSSTHSGAATPSAACAPSSIRPHLLPGCSGDEPSPDSANRPCRAWLMDNANNVPRTIHPERRFAVVVNTGDAGTGDLSLPVSTKYPRGPVGRKAVESSPCSRRRATRRLTPACQRGSCSSIALTTKSAASCRCLRPSARTATSPTGRSGLRCPSCRTTARR